MGVLGIECSGPGLSFSSRMGSSAWFGSLFVAALAVLQTSAQEGFAGPVLQTTDQLLIASVRAGIVDEVAFLLMNGVSPNAATKFGTTALWSASFRGLKEVVDLLVNFGADVNLANQKGISPLYIASQEGYASIVDSLLRAGAEVDSLSKSGSSSLIVAAQENYPDVVELLINAGANLNLRKTKTGQTALWSAAFNGHIEVVSQLLEAGSDANISDMPSGATPLYVSIRHDMVHIAQDLISHGANVSIGIGNGFTPVHLASALGNEDSVKLLIESGADPTILDHQGRSPVDVLGRATTKLPQDVYDRILSLLAQKMEEEAMETTEARAAGNVSTNLPASRPPRQRPEDSTSRKAGLNVILPVLSPVFGFVIIGIAIILIGNMIRMRKIREDEEEENPHRQRLGYLAQPMLVHNMAAAPARGGSPLQGSHYGTLTSSTCTFGEGPSGLMDSNLEVPNVQTHQPTHARGQSLHSVPRELVGSAKNVTLFSEEYWMEWSEKGSSPGSPKALIFKSASMQIKPRMEESEAGSSTVRSGPSTCPDWMRVPGSTVDSALDGRTHQRARAADQTSNLDGPYLPMSPFVLHDRMLAVISDSTTDLGSDSEGDQL